GRAALGGAVAADGRQPVRLPPRAAADDRRDRAGKRTEVGAVRGIRAAPGTAGTGERPRPRALDGRQDQGLAAEAARAGSAVSSGPAARAAAQPCAAAGTMSFNPLK